MFCKTCGSLLRPKSTSYGKWMSCPNGHSQPEMVTKGEEHKQEVKEGKRIEVIEDENPLAVYDHKCKQCGYDKAELREMLASYSDEDNTYWMKCGKCGFVEKLEGKTK